MKRFLYTLSCLALFSSACTSKKARIKSIPATTLQSTHNTKISHTSALPFLVVFDGLGLNKDSKVVPVHQATTHSVMREIYQEWKYAKSRLYFISGKNPVSMKEAEALYQSHISLICRRIAVLNQPLRFYISGYSRGGMMATRLSQDLAKGKCRSNHHYGTAWLGLVDTVSFGLPVIFGKWTFEAPATVHTIHVRTKFKNRETNDKFYFRTEQIANTDYDHVFIPDPIPGRPGPHNSFGFSLQAKNILQRSLENWLNPPLG